MYLQIEKLTKHYPTREIFTEMKAFVDENEVIGIVGANGAGKSTLCKIIAGEDNDYSGKIIKSTGVNISFYRQTLEDNQVKDKAQTVFEYILSTQQHVLDIEKKYHQLLSKIATDPKAMEEFGDVQEEYELLEGYNLLERIEKTLIGLGINEDGQGTRNVSWSTSTRDLSGGERKLVELVTVLLDKKANVLILDEPTNHLDLEARIWFEQFIRNFKGTVLLVSHDRYLLNKVSSKIWEIERGVFKSFKGNYDFYEKEKQAQLNALIKKYDLEQKEYKRLKQSLEKLSRWMQSNPGLYNGMKSRIKKFKSTMMENPTKGQKTFYFKLPPPAKSGRISFRVKNFSFKYNQKRIIYDQTNIEIENKDKIALLGANGSGKSTLMKVVLAKYCLDHNLRAELFGINSFLKSYQKDLMQADLYIGPSVKLAYYSQTHAQLNGKFTIREALKDQGFNVNDERKFQSLIRQFMFNAEIADTIPLQKFSGGEKSRVQLMFMLISDANCLLLDEPINHLDIPTIKVIENVLANYTGTVIVISHDRYFLNKLINKVVYVEEQKLKTFHGNYDEWLAK